MKNFSISILILVLFISGSHSVQAQYFGKNKVKYRPFDFKVKSSETYNLYYYLDNDSTVISLIGEAEKWRKRHSRIFTDSLTGKIPVVIYNNHGDFQQTSIVGGLIGVTTGGVTEGLRNRVTMPLTASYAQTDHVLGHELVHAHQYNMMNSSDSLSLKNMGNIPLWMTEGLAEYMSIGNRDEHTAMWLRDAVLHKYFPAIKDLNKAKYFPYRWGQAFWAFVGGTFGDDKIHDLYLETAAEGVTEAFKKVLGMPVDSFSKRWKTAAEQQYRPLFKGRKLSPAGKKLIDGTNGGRLNISPSLSPDGKYFIFLSEKNIFSIDLYLAQTKNGKIIKRISQHTRRTHMDALDAFQSSGTWSPDSRKYAFIGYSKGKNKMAIASLPDGKVSDEFFIPGMPAFQDPDWSPDADVIAVTGLVQGQSDIYTVNVRTHTATALTHDLFAQIQPDWSPDGSLIAFATDKWNPGQRFPSRKMTIAVMDVKSKKIEYLPLFPQADNLNPRFTPDGKSLVFLSDWDGFRDIYRYDLQTGKIYRLTRFATGVSGITKYAGAISISQNNKIIYSIYNDTRYDIYKISLDGLTAEEVTNDEKISHTKADELPSFHLQKSIVTEGIRGENEPVAMALDSITDKPFKPHFRLDYISSGGIGIATGRYGTGMAGGINLLFGDMMNDNQVFVGAMLNGELQDFGGQAAYLNRKHRYAWGGGLIHYPYRYVTYELGTETVNVNGQDVDAIKETYNLYRIFKEQASLFTYYPFSRIMRVEGGTSFNYYSFRLDKYHKYYTQAYPYYYLGYERERNLFVRPSFGYVDFSLAWVGDSSSFGLTAPMNGYRYRLEVQQSFGRLNMTSLLTDVRGYHYVKPFSLAIRAYQYARLGSSASDNLLPPLYLGYETLVRGYTYKAFQQSLASDANSLNYTDLIGNKIVVTNAEIRFPLTGPKRLSLLKSGFLFTDLNVFYDMGLVWGKYEGYSDRTFDEAQFISSTGVSIRINLFGQLVLEPYYAIPLQLHTGSRGVFGLNFVPGW